MGTRQQRFGRDSPEARQSFVRASQAADWGAVTTVKVEPGILLKDDSDVAPLGGSNPSLVAENAAAGPRVGDVIANRYRLDRVLGRGAMGEVFAAFHLERRHRVAIKVLRTRCPVAAARLLREGRTCARFHNEHILRIFEVGQLAGGAPFLVSEYLPGWNLAEVIARGPVPFREAVELMLQACAALQQPHAAGVVHRDLKPANLFLTCKRRKRPFLKVLDFGISKICRSDGEECDPSLTLAGTILGSPQYMSPEQIRARDDIDSRADIWSLGVILYELLTGQAPFRGRTLLALSAAIANDPPPRLSTVNPELPKGLELVLLRCLEKRADHRYPTVRAMADDIEPFARRQSSMVNAHRSWSRQRPPIFR